MIDKEILLQINKDFGDYLKGPVSVSYVVGTSDGRQNLIISTDNNTITCAVDEDAEIPRLAWRAVAKAWLEDADADHGRARKNGFTYYNGTTRGDHSKIRTMPSELSVREQDVRWRLMFGKELE